MAVADIVRSIFGAPDPRPPERIARDIDDELAFHLGELERDLVEAGASPDDARARAVERFGDPARIRRQCERIAMEDSVMLQKVNFVLMIVVLVGLGAVGAQVVITQRFNTLALQAITADLANMKFEARAAERSSGLSGGAPPGNAQKRDPLDLLEPGLWRQAQPGGLMHSDGAYLAILARDDVENLTGFPSGTLTIPRHEPAYELTFLATGAKNLVIKAIDDGGASGLPHREGRWVMTNGLLILNLGEVAPDGGPIMLVRVPE